MAVGLKDGLRIGVVGGGPAGSAFACALLASARAFGRKVEVTLYDAPSTRRVAVPSILESEARSRLASLGAPIGLRPGTREARGLLVYCAGASALLEPPPDGLWVVDGGGSAMEPREVKEALHSAAVLRGARALPLRVDAVEPLAEGFVVRAQGNSETFDLVAGAFGGGSPLAGRWLGGRLKPPARLLCAHARVDFGGADDLIRVCLAPTDEVDLLVVVPCCASSYVLAIGQEVPVDGLARALMVLARDRALPRDAEISSAERVALSAGPAPRFGQGGAIGLGAALLGSLLEPGLLTALSSAMRGANAVLESGPDPGLAGRVGRAHADLAAHARRQRAILGWARRAGDRTPPLLARVAASDHGLATFGGTLLGLARLPSSVVLPRLRRQAVLRLLSDLIVPAPEPFPEEPSAPPLVYVVDDDPDARSMLVEYLCARGARVRAFGEETPLLEAAARERPAAILLDVVLRWVDGLSLCQALRRHPASARARILSISSLGRRADRDAALSAGADAFLPKPIDFTELERRLEGVLPPLRPEERPRLSRARGG